LRRIGPFLPSVLVTLLLICFPSLALAEPHGGEASLVSAGPRLRHRARHAGSHLLMFGLLVAAARRRVRLFTLNQVKNLPVHKSMSDVSQIIWETCKTYLFQQGRFLMMLEVLVGTIIVIYFGFLQQMGAGRVLILAFSIIGILGSYGVAWFGIRINTYANSRTRSRASKASRTRSTRFRSRPA
jgi:K(+)-stimulated pyrophosphate-energized sodium pump